MSRYRQTMSQLLKEVRKVKEQDENDHEVSMARGELEAIADKATQLASMLQGKSDEGNPLEAWVQSKITKAKDYINSVSDYLMYNPDMKQNEELEEGFTSSLKQKAKEIAKKMANDMTGTVKEIEKLAKGLSDDPEVYKVIKQYNEELKEADNYPTSDINKDKHAAYKDPKKGEKKIVDPEPKIDEGRMSDIDAMRKQGASAEKIAKELKLDVKTVKDILGEENLNEFKKMTVTFKSMDKMSKASTELAKKGFTIDAKGLVMKVDGKGDDLNKYATDLKNYYGASIKAESANEDLYLDLLNEFSDAQISQLKKAYDPLRGRRISGDQAQKLMSIMTKIDYNIEVLKKLVKANIPFVSDLAVARLISKHKFTADKLKPLKAGYMSEGTMIGGLMKYSGQSSSEYMKAKNAYKQFMSKPQPAKNADDKVMAFVFDDQLLDDLYTASKKNVSDVRPMVKKRLSQLGFKESVNEGAKLTFEAIQGLKNKADKTGMPYSILKKVYDRGMAAWKGGHRPGATQQQWALARVNSFVTKSSGTWGGADSDLAAKVKGSKK